MPRISTCLLPVAGLKLLVIMLAGILYLAAWQSCALGAGVEQSHVARYGTWMPPSSSFVPENAHPILQSSIDAADVLHGMLISRLSPGGSLLAASFVNLDNLAETSSMGRLLSQQIASRLGQYGYSVLDARLRHSLQIIPQQGEFMLSRHTAGLQNQHTVEAVLTGTYSLNGSVIFVSTRVLSLTDNAILAAYEYTLPFSALNRNTGDTWNHNSARQQLFPNNPAGAGGAPSWTDPAGMGLQKPLPVAKR